MKPLDNRREATQALYTQLEQGELDLITTSKRMRRIVGMSQTKYAKLIGISAQSLIDFERGVGNPTLKTLRAIGKPFGFELTFRLKQAKQKT